MVGSKVPNRFWWKILRKNLKILIFQIDVSLRLLGEFQKKLSFFRAGSRDLSIALCFESTWVDSRFFGVDDLRWISKMYVFSWSTHIAKILRNFWVSWRFRIIRVISWFYWVARSIPMRMNFILSYGSPRKSIWA